MSRNGTSTGWPPKSPDMTRDGFARLMGRALPGCANVYEAKGGERAQIYKSVGAHEYEMHKAAGTCAVDINYGIYEHYLRDPGHGRRQSERSTSGNWIISLCGIVMPREEPLNYKNCHDSKERLQTIDQLIDLVTNLHDKFGVVHGDIKPTNILRRHDGTLRLCDFGAARKIGDSASEWESSGTAQMLTPRRLANMDIPPEFKDDLYALGITIWMLYSHHFPADPFDPETGELVTSHVQINLNLITDKDVLTKVKNLMKT